MLLLLLLLLLLTPRLQVAAFLIERKAHMRRWIYISIPAVSSLSNLCC